MNILIFNWRDVTHPWSGGAEKYIHEIARLWVKKGYRVTLVCGSYPGALKTEKIDGVYIRRIGSSYTVYLLLPFYYLLKLRNQKFDLIIESANGIPFFSTLYSRRKKILLTHHDHTLQWNSEWNKVIARTGIWLEQSLGLWLYRDLNVVTLSKQSKAQLIFKGFRYVEAIPPGCENGNFKRKVLKTKRPTILYLGRLRKYKRVDLLLKVFKKIHEVLPNTRLIIAGTGQDHARIRSIIQKHSSKESIELKGFVSQSEKKQLLGSSWVLAFPSRMEGWGIVILEAAALGTPAVGFNVSGVNEAISHRYSGFVVNEEYEFANKLLEILTDQNLRKKLSKNSKKWATKFSWESTANYFLSVINQVKN